MTHLSIATRTHRRPVTDLLAAAILAISLVWIGGCAEEETARPANAAVEAQLQQVLERAVAKPGVLLPGAVAHYHNPAYRPWSGAAGLGDLAGKVAMRPHDQIRAGSITKTFLAAVTLQHVEKGTLSLDQTLPALLPESVTSRIASADQITLRMLLNHTSGLPDWKTNEVELQVGANPGRIWTTDEAIDLAAAQPPTFPPGAGWSYSNTNYTLVGLVLDRVGGGKSWRAQVRERIIQPLGLAHTRLPEPGDTIMSGDYARGYHQVGSGAPIDLTGVDPSMAGAAGGNSLVSTAQDLGRFIEALLAGELFKRPETLATMTTMVEARSEADLPYRYGLGLESYTLPGGIVAIGHSGGAAGYANMMYRLPAHDTTIVTSINSGDLFAVAVEVMMPATQVIAAAGR